MSAHLGVDCRLTEIQRGMLAHLGVNCRHRSFPRGSPKKGALLLFPWEETLVSADVVIDVPPRVCTLDGAGHRRDEAFPDIPSAAPRRSVRLFGVMSEGRVRDGRSPRATQGGGPGRTDDRAPKRRTRGGGEADGPARCSWTILDAPARSPTSCLVVSVPFSIPFSTARQKITEVSSGDGSPPQGYARSSPPRRSQQRPGGDRYPKKTTPYPIAPPSQPHPLHARPMTAH
jgi:hypothetical protein